MSLDADTRTPVAAPRGSLGLMFDRMFGILFWGKMFAVVGVWTHSLVAAVVVFDATGSALMVGLVGVVQFGPQLIFGPLSGKLADTGNPERQILVGRILCIVGSGAIAVLLLCFPSATDFQVAAAVLAGSLVVGVGFVVGGPAMQSIVPTLIRDGELPTAMALNSVPMTIGRMIGPIVGAVIAAQLGPAEAFATSAALNFIFVLFLMCVHFPPPLKRMANTDYSVRAALRYVWQDRPLALALLAVGTVGFASDPAITLAPSMAVEVGGGTHLVGQLSAAFGVGAAISLALLAWLRGRVGAARVAWVGLVLLAIGSAVLAASIAPWLALLGFGVAGMGFGAAMTGLSTVVQERAPAELRGRIMALWMVGFVGSRPLAAAVLGGGADLVSAHASFVICAVVVAVTAVFCRPKTLASSLPASR
jgi:MFS family permease